MSTHLDADQLADLQEGLLEPAAEAEARAHLRGCQHCTQNLRMLKSISAKLAAAADVGPMPAHVAARLDAALTIVQEAEAPPGGEVIQLPKAGTRRWWAEHRILQAAAAVVLVLAGGAIGIPMLQGLQGAADLSPSAAGSAKKPIPAAAAPQAGDTSEGTDRDAPTRDAIAATGTDYSDAALEEEVLRTVEFAKATADRQAGSAYSARLAEANALAECIAALPSSPRSTQKPVLVDLARFNGKPATVIVLELPNDPERLGVWVVRPDCRKTDPQVIRQTTVPRN